MIGRKLRNVWRKNAVEVIAWWDGSLPEFVTASRPREPLGGVPVFCYHMVEADIFEADLQFLTRNGYRTLSSNELLGYMEGRLQVPARSLVLTFDDGPRNFFDVAFPLLRKYSAKAIAFIAPGLHLDPGVNDMTDMRPMTWKEIEEMNASGLVEFHSHTLESRYVPNWPMPVPLAGCEPAIEHARRRPAAEPMNKDFELSQRAIESRLSGAQVHQLSFPMYFGTDEAVDIAKTLGFKACHWGLVPGRPLNRPGDSPFYISRISDEFLKRLPGDGRAGFRELLRERLRRAKVGREWRHKYGEFVA